MLLPYLKEELRILFMRLLIVLTDAQGQILIKYWIKRQPIIEHFKELAMSKENIEMSQLATILLNKMRCCAIT